MHSVQLAHEEDHDGWREAARRLAAFEIPADRVEWRTRETADLFGGDPLPGPQKEVGFAVPRRFL